MFLLLFDKLHWSLAETAPQAVDTTRDSHTDALSDMTSSRADLIAKNAMLRRQHRRISTLYKAIT